MSDFSFLSQLHHARNALEAYIFHTRTLKDGAHGDKFNTEATLPLLEEAEDWLYRYAWAMTS